jgi:uncharacterized protein (DUF1015 family)
VERDAVGRATDDAGVTHSIWAVTDPEEIATLTRPLASTPLVIADGHHRYETALAYHFENEGRPGGHDAMMCFCVDTDSTDLFVLPYHRMMVSSVSEDELMINLERLGGVEIDPQEAENRLAASDADHAFVFVLETRSLLLEVDDSFVAQRAEGPDAWRSLDVVALHEAVLDEVAPEGIVDTSFTKDADQVRNDVWTGHGSFGVLMRAVAPVEVVEVATSGARMPQKASHFWPKAITGLVFRPLD